MLIQSSTERKQLPELGLVCITTSDQVRYRTITRKRLLSFPTDEQTRLLRNLYAENLNRLNTAIEFCDSHNIHLYRMPSSLFPFADDVIGENVLTEFVDEMKLVGDRALTLGIRLVLHPDQFVVLNSERPEVIQNSIKILATHARVMDLLGLPRSPWALMNIHGGKGGQAERLIHVIRDLPDPIRSRLTLENDEYTYGAEAILEICHATGVSMVFDAHHHAIYAGLDSYEDPSVAANVIAARTTWEIPEWQLVHISNGQDTFRDPKHSNIIFDMPSAYKTVPWIEIEAKHKEAAIAKLQQEWLPTLTQPTLSFI